MTNREIPLEGLALLDAIAVGETYDPSRYDEFVGGGHFIDFSRFPVWNGRRFAAGISHAAGRYQFQPATFANVAERVGLSDFTPWSQDQAAWWLAQDDYKRRTRRDLLTDLRRKYLIHLAGALRPTWASVNDRTKDHYLGARSARLVMQNHRLTDRALVNEPSNISP